MALNKTRNSTTEITLSDVIRDNTDSSLLGYTASGTGAVTDRTVQDKFRETVSVKDFGAKGDGVTDDTDKVNLAKANDWYITPDGTYLTTLTFNTTGAYHVGEGRITTSDGKRANEVINMTTPPAAWDQGNGILDDFDGDFLSPRNTQISVSGSTTVGDPNNGDGYKQYSQATPFYKRAYFASGKNANPYNNADRTGWSVNDTRIQHYGKGDAVCYSAFNFVNAKDASIELCQGQPAAVLYNGQVTAGDDQVILNPVEVNLVDNGYDVVGKGHVINLFRDNSDETESQFWCGYRVQSVGTQAAGAAYQAVGSFNVGFDTTGATVTRAVALAAGQEIHLDAVTGYHLPAPQWVTSTVYSAGDYVYNEQKIYQTAVGGTAGATPPTHSSGDASDGGVTWTYVTSNDFKSHAKTFGGSKILFGSNVMQFHHTGTLKMSIGTSQTLHYHKQAITLGATDAPFFDFIANADADTTSAISTLTTSGATTHHIQVDINGTKAWIAVSTNAPT